MNTMVVLGIGLYVLNKVIWGPRARAGVAHDRARSPFPLRACARFYSPALCARARHRLIVSGRRDWSINRRTTERKPKLQVRQLYI